MTKAVHPVFANILQSFASPERFAAEDFMAPPTVTEAVEVIEALLNVCEGDKDGLMRAHDAARAFLDRART
jgi:hypothetical protein